MKILGTDVEAQSHTVYVWRVGRSTWRLYASTGIVTRNDVIVHGLSIRDASIQDAVAESIGKEPQLVRRPGRGYLRKRGS